jgi:hypothetical protein
MPKGSDSENYRRRIDDARCRVEEGWSVGRAAQAYEVDPRELLTSRAIPTDRRSRSKTTRCQPPANNRASRNLVFHPPTNPQVSCPTAA